MAVQIENANIDVHVHPFLEWNRIEDVIKAMTRKGLDIVALSSLDATLYPFVREKVLEVYGFDTIIIDEKGIILPNDKIVLNAREYNTLEDLHLLTIGCAVDDVTPQIEIRKIIDECLKEGALPILDHPYVNNKETLTAGHISPQKEYELEDLCKEYSDEIAIEWNGYCVPWIRKGLRTILNLLGHKIVYHDVNKKVEGLSDRLAQQGYNVPVIADTDLHARSRRHLLVMGTSRFITDVVGESASDVISSMKENIFSGNYQNVKRYVSTAHMLEAFCIPILFPQYFKKPRA